MDVRTKKISILDNGDSFADKPSSSFTASYDSTFHSLYFFHNDPFSHIALDSIQHQSFFNKLSISYLQVNDTHFVFPTDQPIRLSHKQNNIKIKYSLIDFENGADYDFFYKLHDNLPWSPAGSQHQLTISELGAGSYEMQLMAVGKDGRTQISKLPFIVAAPFWKTPLFFTVLVGALLILIMIYYRTQIKKLEEKSKLEKDLALMEMKALHAQMNPHFVFNSLNSIREMILFEESEKASHYLANLRNCFG